MTMNRLISAAAGLLLLPAALQAQPDIAGFFPAADSVSEHPPFRYELTTLCQVRVQNRWVSFVGYNATKSLLYVTLTLDSLPDPVADVSPIVDFVNGRPSLGKVTTWGYPFDRNRDGKVDYLALVHGAAPFEDAEFPPNYPKSGESLMYHHVELYLAKCRIVFSHWADDNYDGTIDGVAQVDIDPDRNWINRWILARSKKFNGKFDDVWAFRTDTSSFNDSVSFTPERVSYRPIGAPAGTFGMKELDDKSAVMALINEAVAACGQGAFRLSNGVPYKAEGE